MFKNKTIKELHDYYSLEKIKLQKSHKHSINDNIENNNNTCLFCNRNFKHMERSFFHLKYGLCEVYNDIRINKNKGDLSSAKTIDMFDKIIDRFYIMCKEHKQLKKEFVELMSENEEL